MTIQRLARQKLGDLIVQRNATPPANNPPVWDMQPTPIFSEGTASNYSLVDLTSDPDSNPVDVTLNTGAASLPSGVTYNTTLDRLEYDGVGTVATTTGHIATASDGVAQTDSSSFSIQVQAAQTQSYPLTYTARGGALNMYQTGTAAEDDRKAMGLMDACHIIGYNSGDQADTTPPSSGYISRVDGNIEILAANPATSHYLFTYFVFNEALDAGTLKSTKLYAETGPNGTDWWARDSAGDQVIQFTIGTTDAYGTNISDYASVDSSGDTYPEWMADNWIQPKYIDPHITGGVKIGGANGVNLFVDNFQLHSNKSGIDWNQSGGNDDAQDYYDSEEASHVSADSVAVTAYSAVRANMMKGVNRVRVNNPGILTLPNTNQHADKPDNRLDKPESFAELRNCILEYRLNGDTLQGDYEGGFSEGNSGNSFPRSGVTSDGSLSGQPGNWLQMYFNTFQSVRFAQFPAIVPMSFWVQCLQSGSTGPGGKSIWSPIPASNAYWNVFRWFFCTAQICGAHAAPTGIQVGASTAGRAASTPHFDEFGTINGANDYGFGKGPTKLFYKYAGTRVSAPPTSPLVSHSTGGIWMCETENCLYLVNSDNDQANASYSLDTSLLPGGASRWQHFIGSQDPVKNDGSALGSTLTMPPVDGVMLVDATWYNALSGSQIVAASASEADVQAAIDAASAGDTVQVPAGSATWTNLSLAKAIHLVGSGQGSTNITLNAGNSMVQQSDGITYIRGFSFTKTGGGNGSQAFTITGTWPTTRPIVIEECDITVSGSGMFSGLVQGGVVVAKCNLTAGWDDSIFQMKTIDGFPAGSSTSWNTADTMGDNDTDGESNWYFEDCYLYGGANQMFDADDATRVVWRYNQLHRTSYNTHGLGTSQVGVRHWEIYHNDCRWNRADDFVEADQLSNMNWFFYIRGGTGVVFNNVLDDINGSEWGDKDELRFWVIAQTDNAGTSYGDDSPPTAWTSAGTGDYPRQHQIGVNWDGRASNSGYFIDPVYAWGNTGDGANGSGGILDVGNNSGGVLVENRDFFNDGTQKPGYSPYTYPHPLRQTTGQAY